MKNRKIIKLNRNQALSAQWLRISCLGLLLILILSACDFNALGIQNAVDKTLQALHNQQATAIELSVQTQVALNTLSAGYTPTYTSTFTLEPTPTSIEIPTTTPTLTPTLTPTPPLASPTMTFTPSRTRDTRPCNLARLVLDVTVKDGEIMSPGQTFTKTWRLQNVGSCPWTSDYKLIFVTGDLMGADESYHLPVKVRPGENIDLSIDLKAPVDKGTYAGHYMLQNESGGRFGVGTNANTTFWVGINIIADVGEVYDFTREMCKAKWTSGYGTTKIALPCPGKETSLKTGFVIKPSQPIREDGGLENEDVLLTHPNDVQLGYIQGLYPAIAIHTGDVFRTVLTCQYENETCDVYFELKYQIGSTAPVSLGRWHQTYDGVMESIEIDLSNLDGKNVSFILYVENAGKTTNNYPLWIRPSIWDN